jgi:hypothetical protein
MVLLPFSFCQSAVPKAARQAFGLMPVACLKARVTCAGSANPDTKPMFDTLGSPSIRSAVARRICAERRSDYSDQPSACNRRCNVRFDRRKRSASPDCHQIAMKSASINRAASRETCPAPGAVRSAGRSAKAGCRGPSRHEKCQRPVGLGPVMKSATTPSCTTQRARSPSPIVSLTSRQPIAASRPARTPARTRSIAGLGGSSEWP